MKATEQYFPVALIVMLYKVVLTFESVAEILRCDDLKLMKVVYHNICLELKVHYFRRCNTKFHRALVLFFIVTQLNILNSLIPIFQWSSIVNNQFKLTGLRQQNNHFLI